LSGGNHPSFTRLDPNSTSSTTRSPTVGARPQAHATYRVGDYVCSPFFDPQTWDILGEEYCLVGGTTLHVPVLTLLVHHQPQGFSRLGRNPGRTQHIVLVILFAPPFSTPKPCIYWVRGTVEWGEPPSLDPDCTSSEPGPPTVGARPRAHATYSVGDYVCSPFFDPQTGIYWVRGTVEWGEPPSLYPS